MHSTVVATVDEKGLPTTRVIDMMMYDDAGVYFVTAKGKALYTQLATRPYLSLSAMTMGLETTDKKAISLSGAVRNIGNDMLESIFEENTYMSKIYPSTESRKTLEVFCIYKGKGEYFDLTTKPITRDTFYIGGEKVKNYGYYINSDCNGCGECEKSCPSRCISPGNTYKIEQKHCLHCGNCASTCPQNAVSKSID